MTNMRFYVHNHGLVYDRCAGVGPGSYFEQAYLFYRAGCWPCGYRGAFPGGTFLIHRPKQEA